MNIRIAQEEDFDRLDYALKDTATRLKEKGSGQWSHVLLNGEQETLKKHLHQGEVLIFEEADELAGMCYLYQQPNEWDFGLWQREKTATSYYLHKVIITNAFIGNGYGEKLLTAVSQWVTEKKGEKILLDCKSDVTYLNDFYKKFGFELVGQRGKDDFSELFADFNLYEYHLYQ